MTIQTLERYIYICTQPSPLYIYVYLYTEFTTTFNHNITELSHVFWRFGTRGEMQPVFARTQFHQIGCIDSVPLIWFFSNCLIKPQTPKVTC